MLRGTQVSEERVSNDKAAMREEFEEEVLPLVAKYPDALKKGAVTFEAFLRASAWMSSRSFFVDREHGARCGLPSPVPVVYDSRSSLWTQQL